MIEVQQNIQHHVRRGLDHFWEEVSDPHSQPTRIPVSGCRFSDQTLYHLKRKYHDLYENYPSSDR